MLHDSKRISVGPLAYQLLRTLIEAAPNVVSHDELARSMWIERAVSPETISHRVKLLRDALSDDPGSPRYVEGVRVEGYRLRPRVEILQNESPSRDREESVSRIVMSICLWVIAAVVLRAFAVQPGSDERWEPFCRHMP